MVERHAYGGVFHARLTYVFEKHGQGGLDRLFKKMNEMDYGGPESIGEFKIAQKYPMEYMIILLESYVELFGEEDLARMSREAAKKRGIVGFFVRWAANPNTLVKKASEYWPNFYDFGRLTGEVLDEEKGVLRGYDISPAPIFCQSLSSYYKGIFENIRIKDIMVIHTKCQHRGDDHCEWKLDWKR